MREHVFAAVMEPTLAESDERKDFDGADLSLDALDAVSGGLAVPPGGRIDERQSQYTWFGMTYTQTHRTAYDADGNMVGEATHRPGSVWSDTTETNPNGTRTTYDIGGGGLAAQVTTQHDADGRFQGAGFDGRANFNIGDVNFTGNLRGNVNVDRDTDGNLTGAGANLHGDVGATHEPSGLGVRLGVDANLAGHVERDSEGNIVGGGARLDASVPADVMYQGERAFGLNLAGVHLAGNGRATENGFEGDASASVTRLGRSIGGDAYVRSDGEQVDLGGHVFAQRQALGPYGGQVRVEAGVDATLGGDNPQVSTSAHAHASVFGREVVGTDVSATLDRDGPRATGDFRRIDPATIPSVSLPDVSLPSLPDLRFPDIRLPNIPIPEARTNPTGLPGTAGAPEWQQPANPTGGDAHLYAPQESAPATPYGAEPGSPTGPDPAGADPSASTPAADPPAATPTTEPTPAAEPSYEAPAAAPSNDPPADPAPAEAEPQAAE